MWFFGVLNVIHSGLFFKVLFIHERHTETGRDIGRGRTRIPVGSPMQGSVPGPWDHNMSQRQTLNHGAIQVLPNRRF